MKSSQSNVYEPEPATAFFRSRTTAKEPEPTSTMHIPAGIFPAECQRFPQATCSVHFGTGHRTRADSSNPKRQPPHTIRPGSNATTIPNRNKNDKTMKKTLLFLSLAFLICGKASAQKDDAPYTAFSFGLFPPLCTNGTQAAEYTNGASVNLLIGNSRNEENLVVSGLCSLISERATGVQIAGCLLYTSPSPRDCS